MKIFITSLFAFLLGIGSAQGQGQSQGIYKGQDLAKLTVEPERLAIVKTRQGTIKLQLFEKISYKTVTNFLSLIESGFYDGTTFHRVVPGFMIQGGDPNSKDDDLANDGEGQPNQKTIPLERSKLQPEPGIVAMARKFDENSATSQFFIMHGSAPQLTYQFAIFGQVVEGMDVVDRIANLPVEVGENPGKASEIISVTIEKDDSHSFRNASAKRK